MTNGVYFFGSSLREKSGRVLSNDDISTLGSVEKEATPNVLILQDNSIELEGFCGRALWDDAFEDTRGRSEADFEFIGDRIGDLVSGVDGELVCDRFG